jgi:hypothetical protein
MRALPIVVAGIIALSPVIAGAQHAIPHDVVGCGGGESTEGGLSLQFTVGQTMDRICTEPGTELHPGFWNVVDMLHIGPTSAVAITAFDAGVDAGVVTLSWTVGPANGLSGFNVYRSNSEKGGFVKVNESLIPAEAAEWHDEGVRPATTYWYRLSAIDVDGEFFSTTTSVETPPGHTTLYQNFPNPFNPATTISFYLPDAEYVRLTVYDAAGRVVVRLIDGVTQFGRTDVTWEGINGQGQRVSSGVYFYRLEAGKRVITKKLTLLK